MNYTIGDRELWYPLNDLYLLDDFLPIVSCIKGLTFPCHVQYQYLLSGDEDRVTAWVCKVQCTEALWISAYPYRANQFYACLVIPRYILPDKYISVLTLLSACFHSLTPWSSLFSHVVHHRFRTRASFYVENNPSRRSFCTNSSGKSYSVISKLIQWQDKNQPWTYLCYNEDWGAIAWDQNEMRNWTNLPTRPNLTFQHTTLEKNFSKAGSRGLWNFNF